MEYEEVLKKRLRGMAVRILATIEHTLGADDLESLPDDEKLAFTGRDLKVIRGEILNAAGDTTRSLASLDGPSKPGKLSLSREVIQSLSKAQVDITDADEADPDDEDTPVFTVRGDFNVLYKIRNEVGAGVVYNRAYTCVGIDDIVNSLMPFLDSAQLAGIKIACGDYKEWRDAVCEMYLGGLGNE
jgi:hypothetical protein